MNCPTCQVSLVMSDRSGVEIDYCPQCRGVWLDRGELDKIIERAASEAQPARPVPQVPNQPYREEPRYKYHDRDDDDYYRKKKKKGFLGDIFDF